MREIVFDTETTGLDNGTDRIIEIGGIELDNQFPTGRSVHFYINPAGCPIHPDALAVHGITAEFLTDKPTFDRIAEEVCAFFEGAKWVAHNATFDIGFINAEFRRLGLPPVDPAHVVDTLAIARRRHPMGPNSLDALCRRYGIDNAHRTKHGALLDAELLADVYIELLGGRQAALGLVAETENTAAMTVETIEIEAIGGRPAPLPSRLSAAEVAAHERLIARLGDKALWRVAAPSA
ncbi:DNA polymerase III subunit epsilon [Pseudohoeflea coraliihabitans]|uniref:DNA polymerase III subunit epsilon n=1 Tax=Pseudohoeflea coraliihabitans TaxID=2860393 RepID=A0ABS6WT52_9HYPH|nr:DNA polymerase III subunit epsilon [Pseudohoeflea sp. DP4N28-3]MBW3099133.1 DNA polymerase III subunit epsilon [Pseudohoeflea sp. DP4N28-3]